MKYIKSFENNSQKIYKNDILIQEGYSHSPLFLVLKDANISDDFVNCFEIGAINTTSFGGGRKYASFVFNRKIALPIKVKKESVQIINTNYKKMILDEVKNVDKLYYIYIDTIKEKTGVDLFELSKKWEMELDSEKYNL